MQLNAFKRKKAQTFPPIHDKGLKKSVVLAFCVRNQQLGLFRESLNSRRYLVFNSIPRSQPFSQSPITIWVKLH